MTLTEYLTQQAAELRELAERFNDWAIDRPHEMAYRDLWLQMAKDRRALADHVKAMLADHAATKTTWHDDKDALGPGCQRCHQRTGGGFKVVAAPCPSLRSVAQVVSTVTGTPIPAARLDSASRPSPEETP